MNKFYLVLLSLLIFSCNSQKTEKSTSVNQEKTKSEITETPMPENEVQNNIAENKPDVSVNSEMILIKGGTFLMGSNDGLPQESPVHEVTVKSFYMDKTPVTVAQFRNFIESTGYKTEAEKFGDSGVFNFERGGWELLTGANWKKPLGPSGPNAEDNHPVTHVSWNDALAFAKWAGKRLPTEAEWEFAARSGENSGEKFSWGNQVSDNGKYFANVWQGTLQKPETVDGYLFTSPVGTFGENKAGLTDMGGNVWQWCADNYKAYPGSNAPIQEDPNVKTIRSGSFFYDQYGEDSYSVSGRSMNSHETSLFNTGFRCAKDAN